MSFVKIKYRNTCDIGGSLFSDQGFWYVIFLDEEMYIGKPTFEIIEEGREDGEKNAIIDLKKMTKRYNLKLVVSEYLFDAFNIIGLHDTVIVTNHFGEQSEVFDWQVNLNGWDEDGELADITVSFTVRYDLKTNCCQDRGSKPIWVRCFECNDRVSVGDWVAGPISSVTDPATDRTYYMVGKTNPLTGELEVNQLWYYRYETGWELYDPMKNEMVCFTKDSIDYKFWWDGNFWQPAHVIRDTTDSGATIRVRGWCLPDTWVQLYISTDDITYTPVGDITQWGTFQTVGVTAPGLIAATTYYFKFSMYNNNCNYGYSNTISVVKS